MDFKLKSNYSPCGDQPQAIEQILKSLEKGNVHNTLLGVTGSGKTFSMANIIEKWNKPTLIIAHNKTLAAQLYQEFKQFFPENAVEYFVSYYDYYQPEAYLPKSDVYIEKDAAINSQLEGLRLSATKSLLSRRDVVVISSVSCIYGLGSPETYLDMSVSIAVGEIRERGRFLRELASMQYERSLYDSDGGTFRVRGDVVEVFPSYQDTGYRIEFFDNEVDSISEIDLITGKTVRNLEGITVYPTSHFATPMDRIKKAVKLIREECDERVEYFNKSGKLLEAQRIASRTAYDIELLNETGMCKGIENYSRHIEGRSEGEPPFTLIDYFPEDFLLIVDESHITIPQIGGMFNGDRSRKQALVDYGFRLPSALDNRPLNFKEFEKKVNQILYVSATPGDYELEKSGGVTAEQIIRPTGLLDPEIEVKPVKNQIDDLLHQASLCTEKNQRVLVTTLTKKMAENLNEYLNDIGVKSMYLHSEIDTLERVEILRDLRSGKYDVLVGVNLLREGLDLPEVALIAVLDADKEGFLRSERSLIQVSGRAARNVEGRVIFYADVYTNSIKKTIAETMRRRKIQIEYNKKHNITPATIIKALSSNLAELFDKDYVDLTKGKKLNNKDYTREELVKHIKSLEKEMKMYAKKLKFEKAAELRDKIRELKELVIL